MIAALCELYPVETTAYTAKVVGMSETAVKNKAKELGIVKIAKPLWMDSAALNSKRITAYQQPFPHGLLFGNGEGIENKQDECQPDC